MFLLSSATFIVLSYGCSGEERGDSHTSRLLWWRWLYVSISWCEVSILTFRCGFIVGISPFHIALHRFRLQMAKAKSAWCKVCATRLCFGFQLNKTHVCHLWAQLMIDKSFETKNTNVSIKRIKKFEFVSNKKKRRKKKIWNMNEEVVFFSPRHWEQFGVQYHAQGYFDMWMGGAGDCTINPDTVLESTFTHELRSFL